MRAYRHSLPDRRAARLVALHAASGPHTPGLGLAVLERAREDHVAGAPAARALSAHVDDSLRRAARFLCAEARAGDPRVESLLASLERKWLSLPAAQRLPADGRREAVWNRLVALCLEEFGVAPVAQDCGGVPGRSLPFARAANAGHSHPGA